MSVACAAPLSPALEESWALLECSPAPFLPQLHSNLKAPPIYQLFQALPPSRGISSSAARNTTPQTSEFLFPHEQASIPMSLSEVSSLTTQSVGFPLCCTSFSK